MPMKGWMHQTQWSGWFYEKRYDYASMTTACFKSLSNMSCFIIQIAVFLSLCHLPGIGARCCMDLERKQFLQWINSGGSIGCRPNMYYVKKKLKMHYLKVKNTVAATKINGYFYLKFSKSISVFLIFLTPIKLSFYQSLISAIPDSILGKIWKFTFFLIGTPDIGNINLLKGIFLYGFTVLSSLKANTSFTDLYGAGNTNSLNKDLPSSTSLLSL